MILSREIMFNGKGEMLKFYSRLYLSVNIRTGEMPNGRSETLWN